MEIELIRRFLTIKNLKSAVTWSFFVAQGRVRKPEKIWNGNGKSVGQKINLTFPQMEVILFIPF